jgi:hypothetical protein
MLARLLLFGLIAGAGCARVKPYEREYLALPGMEIGDASELAADQHVFESREGSAGGYGSIGTGCGCN